MKRKALKKIQQWYQNSMPNVLYMDGAKGVGKTRIIFDFLTEFTGSKVYLNVELNQAMKQLLDGGTIHEIVTSISNYFAFDPTQETIVIIDECYYYKECISTIVEQANQVPSIKFILLSSYYIQELDGQSERYTKITLYPLDFEEFLEASNNPWYASVIREHFISLKPIPEIVHNDILNLFFDYLMIGGMPNAINESIALDSMLNVTEQHHMCIHHQLSGLKYCTDDSTYLKAIHIYDTIDEQLKKKNKKFQYTLIRKGATQNQFQGAKELLLHNHIILEAKSNIKGNSKLYCSDCGFLVAKAQFTATNKELSINSELYQGVLENYVAQTLHTNGHRLQFWESGGTAKLDFLINKDGLPIPIEVFSDEKTKSKAVSIYKETHLYERAIKISPKNFSKKGMVTFIPFYAVFCI